MEIYRNYAFGEEIKNVELSDISNIIEKAKEMKEIIYNQDKDYIIDTLSRVGEVFKDKKSVYYKIAMEDLVNNITFSRPMIEKTLDIVGEILDRKELNRRLSLEAFFPYALDNIMERHNYDGYIKAYPKGVVLHIGAGNVFIGVLDSLVMGMITKNINIVKVSSSGSNFMNIFAMALKDIDRKSILSKSFAVLHWRGGRKDIEEELAKNVDMVMVWGGYDAVETYRKILPFNVDIEAFGPKTSFGIVFEDYIDNIGYSEVARRVVRDVAMWDQQACSNMHTLYIVCKEDRKKGIIEKLISELVIEFKKFARDLPPQKLSDDEKVEITKAREIAKIDMAFDKAEVVYDVDGTDYTIIYEKEPAYRISPLNRVLYIKAVNELSVIKKEVKKYSPYIQSVGIGGNIIERKNVVNEFYSTGAMRFTILGAMTEGKTGSPHDGRFVLSRLLNWVSLEGKSFVEDKIVEIVNFARNKSRFYKEYYSGVKEVLNVEDFKRLPLIEKRHILENTPPASDALFTSKPSRGIYFASGGSTGEPKYVFYDQHEYEHTIRMLAYAYEAAGLSENDVIANLFVAGNLWSSWLSVEKAIAYTKATSVPVGSNLPMENIVKYLMDFKVTAIIGLPSFIIKLANYLEENKITLNIKKIFYGGEYVSDEMIGYLEKVFKNVSVKSAGYATSDAGVIGFQCAYSSKGVHHLFEHSQYIEILDPETHKPLKPGEIGEVVVTSLNKKRMPIIRYRVGDLARLLPVKCKCGRNEMLFEILGRCDDRIHAGGAHIFVGDIQNAIGKIDELSFNFQVVIYKKGAKDHLEIVIESREKELKNKNLIIEKVYKSLLENCLDLKESIDMGLLPEPEIKIVPPNTIERIKRTGKIKRVVDKRIKI